MPSPGCENALLRLLPGISPFLFPSPVSPAPRICPAYQHAQTTEAACSPVSPRRHRRGACLLSTLPRPPPRAVEDPSASGTLTESVPDGSSLRPCQEDPETPAAQGQHLAPGLQSARHHFRIFPRKTAVELGVQRVSQRRKGPQGPRAVGLGLGAAAALGMWVQVQFLPLRLPLRGFQREWPEEPTGETRHSPCHPAPGSVPVSCGHVSDRIPHHPSLNSSPFLALGVQTALPQPPPLA